MAGQKKYRWTQQHSAGGVVVRREDEVPQFLAIKPANRDRWQLPKGTIDQGETARDAAVREVREEGGVHARILTDLGPINFFYHLHGRHFAKTVDFYLMDYQSGTPADHDHEVQEARWFPLTESALLAFPTERALVDRAREILPSLGTAGATGE